jgi:hypothetical protein
MNKNFVFNHLGQVRPLASFTQEELDEIPAERRAEFDELYAALAEQTKAEQAIKDAEAEIKRAKAQLDLKQIKFDKTVGKVDYHTLWRRDVAKIEENPSESEQAETRQLQAELDAARENWQAKIEIERTLNAGLRPIEKRVDNALNAWRSTFPVLTPTQAIKDHINRTAEHRTNAKNQYERAQRVMASVLDAHSGGGKGPVGIRSSDQARRGAYPGGYQNRVIPNYKAPVDGGKPLNSRDAGKPR